MKLQEYNTKLNADRLPILAESMQVLADGRKRYIDNVQDAADLIRSIIGDYAEEHAIALFFDNKLKLSGFCTIGVGTVNATFFDVRGLFQKALMMGAVSIIVAHNHPSGNPEPSQEDKDITKRIKEAGELLGITVSDHIIIGENGSFYSFMREKEI